MDMKKVLEMKQERATITNSIRAIMDEFEGKEMDPVKKAELAKNESRFDVLNINLVAEERQIERERVIGEVSDGTPVKNPLRNLFAKALSGEYNDVVNYRNAMSLSTDATAGALTAPMDFRAEVIRGLDNMLFMRQLANIVGPIGQGQSLGFPYRKTDAADGTWLAEVTAAAEETTLDFGRREFKPNKMAKLLKVSRTLIQHASIAEQTVLQELLYKIGAGQEGAYMTGNGTAQPLGIFTASASGITTGRDVSTDNTATQVTFDGLMNAKYAVKQQYLGNASWVGHRDFAKQVAKIKDGEGQYIWAGGVVAGQPDRLLGSPVYMSEYAPNTFTTGLYVAVFGNFKVGYWICDADQIYIQILKELYAVTNQIGYIVDYFGDGAPVIEEAFARVKLG